MGKRFASGALVVSMIVAGIVTVAAGIASASTASDESHFVSLINYERTTDTKSWSCGRAGGLNALSVASDLVAVARKHSEQMAAKGTIWHDSSTWNSVSGWSEYGENVGMGPSDISDPVGNLHTAFMNSSEHCQNILFSHSNPVFNQVGVGVVISNNTMYVTEIFVRRSSGSSSTTYHRSTTTRSTTTHHTTTYHPVASVTRAAAAKPKPKPLAAPPVATPQTVDLLVRMIGMDSDNVDPATGAAAGF
ncbi:MAG TPA: CAP domain-containing protein [Actinomycetota bacterium]|nr:CAP domain-containing protein [Actinomycetota bacterium]